MLPFNYRTSSGSLRESGVMVYTRLSHCLPNILNGHGDGGRLESIKKYNDNVRKDPSCETYVDHIPKRRLLDVVSIFCNC